MELLGEEEGRGRDDQSPRGWSVRWLRDPKLRLSPSSPSTEVRTLNRDQLHIQLDDDWMHSIKSFIAFESNLSNQSKRSLVAAMINTAVM